jgi:hypothetical protein
MKAIDEVSGQSEFLAYSIAAIHAALADTDRAFEWLSKACQTHSFQLVSLKVDPCFDNIRSDPRFPEVLRQVGLAN